MQERRGTGTDRLLSRHGMSIDPSLVGRFLRSRCHPGQVDGTNSQAARRIAGRCRWYEQSSAGVLGLRRRRRRLCQLGQLQARNVSAAKVDVAVIASTDQGAAAPATLSDTRRGGWDAHDQER